MRILSYFVRMHAWMYVLECTHTCGVLREGQLHAYCNMISVRVYLDVRVRVYAYVFCVQSASATRQYMPVCGLNMSQLMPRSQAVLEQSP